jgi:hypothetical protein
MLDLGDARCLASSWEAGPSLRRPLLEALRGKDRPMRAQASLDDYQGLAPRSCLLMVLLAERHRASEG